MKQTRFVKAIKGIISSTWFRPGTTHRIIAGPLRGRRVRASSTVGLSALYSGAERNHQLAFARILCPGDTVIDVGANWGLHTLFFSTLVGPTGRVFAFEPLPEVFEELRWHLSMNGCANTEPIPVALCDQPGHETFKKGSSTYTGSLSGALGGAAPGEVSVPTDTVDRFVRDRRIPSVRLLKIDVEGAESRVLDGARQTVEQFRPFFVIDLHTPAQDLAVADFLVQRNYALERLGGPPIDRMDLSWPCPEGVWGTILARPSNGSR